MSSVTRRVRVAVLRGAALAAARAVTGTWSLLERLAPREQQESPRDHAEPSLFWSLDQRRDG